MGNTKRNEPFGLQIHAFSELLDIDLESLGCRGLIFDYGGTIDSRGMHWSEVISRGYSASGVEIPYDDFWEAYVYAERELARVRLIAPTDNFLDLMRKKIAIELRRLKDTTGLRTDAPTAEAISLYCYDYARKCTSEARPVLEALAGRFPMVMVSNFYGNLDAVLEDFGLRDYFNTVIDSTVVGIRKPDAGIFRLGLEALSLSPAEAVTIGDSHSKDILPSRRLGINTVQLTIFSIDNGQLTIDN